MSIEKQARNPSSTLCSFLDLHLPQRTTITKQWAQQLSALPPPDITLEPDDSQWLGKAAELRIGLDLADEPGYWDVLSFLPADWCTSLLTSSGYAPKNFAHLPDGRTSDPLLRSWTRVGRPTSRDDHQEQTLHLCLHAAEMDPVAHQWDDRHQADFRRSIFLSLHDVRTTDSVPAHSGPLIDAFADLWTRYLQCGREQLDKSGQRVLMAPHLAPGFAIADLVLDSTLVEIKTVLDPVRDLDIYLNQVLGYALLDQWDILNLDVIAVYFSRQAVALAQPIAEVLIAATPGTTPTLADLRAQFRNSIGGELDAAAADSCGQRIRSR